MIARNSVVKLVSLAALALVLVSSTACLVAGSTEVTGVINQPNSLGLGGSDDGIIVTFIEVLSDSRCAAGVQCVDAGKADVKIGVSVDSGPVNEFSLPVISGSEAAYITGKYTVKLLRLLPDPPPQGGVPQGDYQLELSITSD